MFSWRQFTSIGRRTPVGEVWGVIRKMGGERREWDYPVMWAGGETAVTDREKVEVMAGAFARVHSEGHLTEEERRGRGATLSKYPGVLDRREDTGGVMDDRFTMAELVRAIDRAKHTAPGWIRWGVLC